MYRLYLKHKDNDLLYLIPLVILAQLKFVGYIVRFLSRGATLPYSEDSVWYINYAGAFIANLMDGLDINDTLYFGYNSLLATLLAIFGNTTAIVITQAITAGFAVKAICFTAFFVEFPFEYAEPNPPLLVVGWAELLP